ncbi:latent-transforming growth factor beta-binding protein 4-like isoform X2 [Achroia grisella]|uniref:latent-transforming growth factor beta-binding protein 4-like isoform X2 n=1 Tax=Achroia grisella TaxID=688607 RepID=UPI0027D274A3|nr:latent-transforming growth factor beta-binding protein 4-like isoform X2 [Achroia grisella]
MKYTVTLFIVLCIVLRNVRAELSPDEVAEITESCCSQVETMVAGFNTPDECDTIEPYYTEPDEIDICRTAIKTCCEDFFKQKNECSEGMKYAKTKQCSTPKSKMGKVCCDECVFGKSIGELRQDERECGELDVAYLAPTTVLKNKAYIDCCLEAARQPTTTEKIITTTKKIVTTTKKIKEKCKSDSCEHVCNDDEGKIKCHCHEGYRLQDDKRSCKDVNECAEAIDDLCTAEDTVCHNTPGAFKCVPIKKRAVGLSCPAGFKKNVQSQVCDDINECQHPRPPCPKYLCENTIGGFKCAGKPGIPYSEESPDATTEIAGNTDSAPRNDICPVGFRAGPDDECLDIDECEERLDDCQRLSQHCINTHGSFFCQDHVSKRCTPGFKVNSVTGICEDINECEDSMEVCKRTEVCINLPGAYNCKSKISTLPKLAKKTCQEGTRIRPGGTICEDIDECREGTHLCDEFQNCINTYGAHECRCKNGFEIDPSSGSCVDVDECSLKLDKCSPGTHCVNTLGSYTCSRRGPITTSTSTTVSPSEYEYYYEEDNSTDVSGEPESIPPTTSSTTPTPRTRPTRPTPKPTTTPRTTTPRRTTSRPPTTTTRTTTSTSTTPPPPRTSSTHFGSYPPRTQTPTTSSTPFTNRPERPIYTRPTTTPAPRRPYRPQDRPRRPDDASGRPEDTPNIPDEPTRGSEDEPEQPPRRPLEDTPKPENRPIRPATPRTDNSRRRPSYSRRPSDPRPEDRPRETTTTLKPEENNPDIDVNNLHCLHGYERDSNGNCVDVDECQDNRYACSSLEMCVNREGGYVCECISGFRRDTSGWCAAVIPTSTTTVSTTTESTTTVATTPRWRYTPRPRPYSPKPVTCDFGYKYNSEQRRCIDIDECATNQHSCARNEDCVNVNGGYNCVCGKKCRAENGEPNVYYPVSPNRPRNEPTPSSDDDVNSITVGAQYGQRGPRQMRASFSRVNYGGIYSCRWGYKLTSDKMCIDIDECAGNESQCGPQQHCENFYGGYSCKCPSGHKLYKTQDQCEDIDECYYGSPCSYNSNCINTVGSYRCECNEGFRNAPSNDKMCADIDECSDDPNVCEQDCVNTWGSYRCYCRRGYRLDNNNRTCVDVDECKEWSASRLNGRLCNGQCINEPGSYRCSCPAGYKLAEDRRSCIDINECETGEASCARSNRPGDVCQNTRGSYHCHRIECPDGYRLESKHRCTRIQRSCPIADWSCLQQPSAYSYNFITFVANIYMPTGRLDLFTMHGPGWRDSVVTFELRLIDAQSSGPKEPADLGCFDMQPTNNVCLISLLCPLPGPQVIELELTMSLYQHDQFAGSAVARIIIIVSEYEF